MIRNITVDGEEALAVDTAEELGRALVTGRYVVASDAVRAEYGLTDTDNSDTQDIVDASDWRDDAWRAEGGALMAWGRKTTAAQKPARSQDDYHTAFASKIKEQIEQGARRGRNRGSPASSGSRKHPDRQAVPGREFGLPQRDPNREGLQR